MATRPSALAAAAAAGVAVGLALSALWRQKKRGAEQVNESTIRLMTRVAIESGAVNLSQGFPNEPPPREMACAAAGALLCGASAASAAAAALVADAPHRSAPAAAQAISRGGGSFGKPWLRFTAPDSMSTRVMSLIVLSFTCSVPRFFRRHSADSATPTATPAAAAARADGRVAMGEPSWRGSESSDFGLLACVRASTAQACSQLSQRWAGCSKPIFEQLCGQTKRGRPHKELACCKTLETNSGPASRRQKMAVQVVK